MTYQFLPNFVENGLVLFHCQHPLPSLEGRGEGEGEGEGEREREGGEEREREREGGQGEEVGR